MPDTNPETSGPRKRTLSTKAATNGDPNAEQKRQKLGEVQKRGAKMPLTKKKPTTTSSKKKGKKAAKTASRSPSANLEGVSDKPASDFGASDDNTNGRNGESDDSEDMDEDTVEVLEAPEESAEDQLGTFHLFSKS